MSRLKIGDTVRLIKNPHDWRPGYPVKGDVGVYLGRPEKARWHVRFYIRPNPFANGNIEKNRWYLRREWFEKVEVEGDV
jgi:hypothetical protein